MPKFAYVSVAQSAQEWMTISQLEEFATYRWATTPAKAMECERLIAVYDQTSVAAWPIRGAYADTVGTYSRVATTDGRAPFSMSVNRFPSSRSINCTCRQAPAWQLAS